MSHYSNFEMSVCKRRSDVTVPIMAVTSQNIDASQNTKKSALYITNPSQNGTAHVKLNSKHFLFSDCF